MFRNLIVLTSSLRRERKLALFFNAFLGTLLCNNAMVAQMEQNSYEKSIHVLFAHKGSFRNRCMAEIFACGKKNAY